MANGGMRAALRTAPHWVEGNCTWEDLVKDESRDFAMVFQSSIVGSFQANWLRACAGGVIDGVSIGIGK